MDANFKLGNTLIPGDPYEMSPNWAILAQIVERHNMIVANGISTCKGTITRQRQTRTRNERSVIDLVLFSSDMMHHLVNIEVDEARKYVLTMVVKKKNGIRLQKSDHNPILTEFALKVEISEDDTKKEMYNLKKQGMSENVQRIYNKHKDALKCD